MICFNDGGEVIRLDIDGFMDKERFSTFRKISTMAGSEYKKSEKINIIPTRDATLLSKILARSGFEVSVDNGAREKIHSIHNAQKKHIAEIIDPAPLFPFQAEAAKFLLSRSKALLADSMGLGKTISAISAIESKRPVVIIVPASLKANWRKEILKWGDSQRNINIIDGEKGFRPPEDDEIIIMSYNSIYEYEGKMPYNCILIADEAHALKNKKSKRSKAFCSISKSVLAENGSVWLLTGTPMPNSPMELWNVLSAAQMERMVFGSWENFVKLFRGMKNEWNAYTWGVPNKEAIKKCFSVSVLRRRKENVIADLPGKIHRDIDVEIDREMLSRCEDGLVEEAVLQSIASDKKDKIKFEELSKFRRLLSIAKIPKVMEIIETYEEAREPIVVFSNYVEVVEEIAKRNGWVGLTGNVSTKKRDEYVNTFQSGTLKGIAITIGAGGVGITLTRANQAIFVDLSWTPADNSQAEDRIYRIGQTRGVIINRIIANHKIDQHVASVLLDKQILLENSLLAEGKKE